MDKLGLAYMTVLQPGKGCIGMGHCIVEGSMKSEYLAPYLEVKFFLGDFCSSGRVRRGVQE